MRNRSQGNPAKDYAGDRRRKKGVDPSQNRDFRVVPEGTAPPEERAILISVGTDAHAEDGELPTLDELAELARTAGARVVGRLYQRRIKRDAATYLGKGKVDELKKMMEEAKANLVVADDDLSPAQVRNLEEVIQTRVIDRSELIIDIFARHARTPQAKLQVELAQLQYMSPRLKRMWTHLSRITGTGGVGSRGPGEKQIEVDRRLVKRRIEELRAELGAIEGRRERLVRARGDVFNVALVGYTNVGKSTLMNRLTGADVFVADMLFATLDTRTRKMDVGDAAQVLLSDTVGFIDKLPHHLVASFHATLAEVTSADLLLHVVDGADDDADHKIQIVRDVLKAIGAAGIPELLVINKADRVTDRLAFDAFRARIGDHVVTSAVTGEGLDLIRARVREGASAFEEVLDLEVPAADGKTLALIASTSTVVTREYVDETCRVRVRVPRVHAHLFEKFVATSTGASAPAGSGRRGSRKGGPRPGRGTT